MSFSSSKTWLSRQAQESEKWATIQVGLDRICPRSPFTPKNFSDFVEHKIAIAEDRSSFERHKAATLEAEQVFKRFWRSVGWVLYQPFNGRSFNDCRGSVLSQFTIWCDSADQKVEQAGWPCALEMKWEGDERALTGNGRFLGLPRFIPAYNSTVTWHQLRRTETFELDVVWPVPTVEDIVAPVDEVDIEVVPCLLNSDLIDCLDIVEMY